MGDPTHTTTAAGNHFDTGLAALNETAKTARNLVFSFLLFGTAITIVALGASEETLFREGAVRIPLVNADVPVTMYFWLTPAALVLLHLNAFMRCMVLRRRIGRFREKFAHQPDLDERLREEIFPFDAALVAVGAGRGPLERGTQFLFSAMTLHVVPIIMLLLIQARFVIFHSDAHTLYMAFLVLLNLTGTAALAATVGKVARVKRARTATEPRPLWRRIVFAPLSALAWLREANVMGKLAGVMLGGLAFLVSALVLVPPPMSQDEVNWAYAVGMNDRGWTIWNGKPIPAAGIVDFQPTWASRLFGLAHGFWRGADISIGSQENDAETDEIDETDPRTRWISDGVWEGLGDVSLNRSFSLPERTFWEREPDGVQSVAAWEVAGVEDNMATDTTCWGAIDDVNVAKAILQRDRTENQFGDAISFSGRDLRQANLSRARLVGADLFDAVAHSADLICANLTDARLIQSRLKNVNLNRAQLTGADLRDAQLTGADLRGAQLTGADLEDAELTGAILLLAELTGADLRGAELTGGILPVAQLTGADLAGAQLTGAILEDATLTDADLRRAQLTGADLAGAQLTGAFLEGAELTGADLGDTDLRLSAGSWNALLSNEGLAAARSPLEAAPVSIMRGVLDEGLARLSQRMAPRLSASRFDLVSPNSDRGAPRQSEWMGVKASDHRRVFNAAQTGRELRERWFSDDNARYAAEQALRAHWDEDGPAPRFERVDDQLDYAGEDHAPLDEHWAHLFLYGAPATGNVDGFDRLPERERVDLTEAIRIQLKALQTDADLRARWDVDTPPSDEDIAAFLVRPDLYTVERFVDVDAFLREPYSDEVAELYGVNRGKLYNLAKPGAPELPEDASDAQIEQWAADSLDHINGPLPICGQVEDPETGEMITLPGGEDWAGPEHACVETRVLFMADILRIVQEERLAGEDEKAAEAAEDEDL